MGAAGPCPRPLRLCLFLKVCGEEAFCGSHVSLQRPGHLCPKGPHFVTVDTCILTKIRALAAAVVQDAPVTH